MPEQQESDQQSEVESESSLPRGVPSRMDNMIATIRHLEQTNAELEEKALVTAAQLNQLGSQSERHPEPPTSDDKSGQNCLVEAAAGNLEETNSKLSKKLAAAKERINELESRIKTIEKASSKVRQTNSLSVICSVASRRQGVRG